MMKNNIVLVEDIIYIVLLGNGMGMGMDNGMIGASQNKIICWWMAYVLNN